MPRKYRPNDADQNYLSFFSRKLPDGLFYLYYPLSYKISRNQIIVKFKHLTYFDKFVENAYESDE